MKITKNMERWSPLSSCWWRAAAVAAGGAACSHPRVHLPQPLADRAAVREFKGPLLEAAWKTFWVTMLGFALSIVVGVLLGFLIGSSRLAYTRCTR
jgi:NitT/TauT family transport system permease protein